MNVSDMCYLKPDYTLPAKGGQWCGDFEVSVRDLLRNCLFLYRRVRRRDVYDEGWLSHRGQSEDGDSLSVAKTCSHECEY